MVVSALGDTKGIATYRLLWRGMCASAASLPRAMSTAKGLWDAGCSAPLPEDPIQPLCTFNSSRENSDWDPKNTFWEMLLMSWKAVEYVLCYRDVAPKHRENREGRDKIALRDWRKASQKRAFTGVESRQVGGTAGIVTCRRPTPEGEGKTLGHIPPFQSLWSIWGRKEILRQEGTLTSEGIQMSDTFSWGTLRMGAPAPDRPVNRGPGQGLSLFQPCMRADVICSVDLSDPMCEESLIYN